ncbi:MAG: TonB-dependent receptor [Reichenbachiella sp.]
MKKIIIIVLIVCFSSGSLMSQNKSVNIQGTLIDSENGSAIVGATVIMVNIKDSTRSKYDISNHQGNFKVQELEKAFYRLKVQSLGFRPYSQLIRIGLVDLNLGVINLQTDAKVLKDISVEGEVIPVEQRGDTTVFNAQAYKVNPDASSADLVSKMPGIVVDETGVTADGESVQQVLLDGKKYFGQDPLLSLNTIPAEIVDAVEVFDQQSEQSQFTGVDDGNSVRTMNVVTKEDKRNGRFGTIYAGYGTNERYKSGGSINSFNKNQRITIMGLSNNINKQNFSTEDLAGVSGGQRGRSRRGGNNNFMTGEKSGITNTNSIGLNFTDDWGSKATFEGSYFYNSTENTKEQINNRETYFEEGNQFYTERINQTTNEYNHRINSRITYNVNEKNRLVFTPSFSFQDNKGLDYTNGILSNDRNNITDTTENNYLSDNIAYNISNRISYLRKLEKVGRSISIDVNTRINSTDKENYFEDIKQDSITQYLTNENQLTIGGKITFNEPVGKSATLSAGYQINYSNRDAEKETYQYDAVSDDLIFDPTLSNDFTSGYTTHRPSLSLINRGFGSLFYQFGVSYQHATLNNEQVLPTPTSAFQNKFNSILPNAMLRSDFKNGGSIFLRYRASTNEPSVNQLQNVIDNSNPFFWSIGNPDLNQSYTHRISLRLRKSNTDKNTSVSNYTDIRTTDDYMTNATYRIDTDTLLENGITIPGGSQVSQPVNMDGYWRLNNSTTFSWLISKIKCNVNTVIGLSYTRQPGVTNGVINIANTYSGNMRVALVSNFSEKIDFNLYYNSNRNLVHNSIQTDNANNYTRQKVGAKLNFIFWKGMVFRNDFYYEKYLGVNEVFDTDYVLWNISVAKKFLKNDSGELALSVFDLLNQNVSTSQSVNPGYIEETRTQVLQQFFMLTFTYQLRNFKGQNDKSTESNRRERR